MPRYYTKLYERMSEKAAEKVKAKRRVSARAMREHIDFTPRRLRDRNEVAILKSQQKRELK